MALVFWLVKEVWRSMADFMPCNGTVLLAQAYMCMEWQAGTSSVILKRIFIISYSGLLFYDDTFFLSFSYIDCCPFWKEASWKLINLAKLYYQSAFSDLSPTQWFFHFFIHFLIWKAYFKIQQSFFSLQPFPRLSVFAEVLPSVFNLF